MNLRLDRIHWVTAALTFVVATLASGSGFAQTKGTLNATVKDPQGVVVSHGTVILRRNNLGNEAVWRHAATDKFKTPDRKSLQIVAFADGQFSVELAAGSYDVFAYLDGFVPTCTIADVEAGKTSTMELRVPRVAASVFQ